MRCRQGGLATWFSMGRIRASVLFFTGAMLCREGLPFVLWTGKGTRLPRAHDCSHQAATAIPARTVGRSVLTYSMSLPDECIGVGPTPEWHRVAHRNGERVRVGDHLPTAEVRRLESDGMLKSLSLRELFGEKKGVLVGVPGAFTPTCSKVHLPEFIRKAPRLAAKGVELVAVVAMNDVFVMKAWEESQGANGKVLMLSDGNGDLTAQLGMMVDMSAQGMGLRSKRFMCMVVGGKISHVTVDEGDGARGVCATTVERILDEFGWESASPRASEDMSLEAELERKREARAGAAAAAAAQAAASAAERNSEAGEAESLAV